MTYDEARSLLDYDALTGVLTWRAARRSRSPAGGVAGYRTARGYVQVRIGARTHFAHRLAWLLSHGEPPRGVIDHINGNPSDNRLANLRDVTPAINSQNQRRATRRNASSGLLGVTRNSAGWQASLRLDGRQHHIGTFQTREAAHAAYLEAKRRLHPGCTI